MAKNTKIVSLNGPPCPRCGCPTEIREHERITEKELAKQFYYSRWHNCPNRKCKTTIIHAVEFKVWKEDQAQQLQDAVTTPVEHRNSAESEVPYVPPDSSPPPPIESSAVFVKNGFKASLCLECGQVDLISVNEDHRPCTVCGAEPVLT
jgi:hypothetical protein